MHNKEHEDKVFCIGYWKTGTTSTKTSLKELGYEVGNQAEAEILIFDWAKGNYSKIIDYCHSANAFQDTPFCCDNLYRELDIAFPKSKFILTVRESSEQWFSSLCRFHTKLFSTDKSSTPTKKDLQEATYRYSGYLWDSHKIFWGEKYLYDKRNYISRYETYNQAVIKYFGDRPKDLLILNVAHETAYKDLCVFLNKAPLRNNFPWKNKT